MLSGEGMHPRKTVKNNNRAKQQKQLCACSTLSLYISLPLFCKITTRNFQKLFSYTFYGGNVVRVPVHFFSQPLIFTLRWWPLAFLILSPLQNFHVVLPTKKCLLRFFISRSKSLSPFFSLSFAGLPPTFSFSLSFACSRFQICGHDNIYLSLILQTTLNFRFPFSSLLTLLLSLLYKTPVAMRFPAKITSSCIWVAIPVDRVILHWYACGADGRSLGRCTVT